MSEPITYAKSGGPPDDWCDLRIFDMESGREVKDVYEVNVTEGWLLRYQTNERGMYFTDPANPGHVAVERLTGRFEIRRPA